LQPVIDAKKDQVERPAAVAQTTKEQTLDKTKTPKKGELIHGAEFWWLQSRTGIMRREERMVRLALEEKYGSQSSILSWPSNEKKFGVTTKDSGGG